MDSVFPIILQKENTQKLLFEKSKEFEESNEKYPCIDLSATTVPNSTMLGEIVRILRLTMNRNGTTFIFTDSKDTLELLDGVHISNLSTIIKDREKFDEILKGNLTGLQKDSSKKWPTHKKNEKEKMSRVSPATLILFITNFISIITLIFFSYIYSRDKKIITGAISELLTQTKTIKTVQIKQDSLSNRVSELEVLNEISE